MENVEKEIKQTTKLWNTELIASLMQLWVLGKQGIQSLISSIQQAEELQ
jgi:hypothetical protein